MVGGREIRLRHWVAAWTAVLLAACGGRSAPSSEAPSDGGVPTPCVSGALCEPNGNPCETGTTSCSAGQATCVLTGDLANGTGCGAGLTCLGGLCSSCTAGALCNPGSPPDVCQTGTISCAGGQATCLPARNAPDGTGCGMDQICCGGACASCSALADATEMCAGTTCEVTCNNGFTLCGALCTDTTADEEACGPSCRVCPSGSACIESVCSVEYGDFTAFSCNSSPAQMVHPGFIGGEAVSVSAAVTLTALGVIGSPSMPSGVSGILLLYTSVDNLPSAIVARTASTALPHGNSEIPVTAPVPLAPGTYWIMAEYQSTADVCIDSATSNTFVYASIPSYGTVPTTLPSASLTAQSYEDLNYYLVGTE
jgi:hypothetical protein